MNNKNIRKIYLFPCDEKHASWGEIPETRALGVRTSCETSYIKKTQMKKRE